MPTEVVVPPLGQTVDMVTLVAWHKDEGEAIVEGEMLFAIETDKATLDIEAPASGVLRRVQAQPGDEVTVLSAIALIVAPDEVLEETLATPDPEPVLEARWPSPGVRPSLEADGQRRIFVSPRARRLAEEHGIPLVALKASGPEGAIVERDVRAHLAAPAPTTIKPVAGRVAKAAKLDGRSLPGSGPGGRIMPEDGGLASGGPERGNDGVLETVPVRGLRAVIVKAMSQSASVTAPVALNAKADATALVDLRRKLKEDGTSVSYNALFLHVLGRALTDHPRLNASLVGDTIQVWTRIDIGLAVDADRGLLVPVVRGVDRKGLAQLEGEIHSLVERARAGRCSPEELSGGTFALTNLGMFGIDSFTPIINLPECASLGVGRIKTEPAFVEEQVVARQMVWLSLNFDHRLVDGAPAARFMQRVVQLIERPHLLLT